MHLYNHIDYNHKLCGTKHRDWGYQTHLQKPFRRCRDLYFLSVSPLTKRFFFSQCYLTLTKLWQHHGIRSQYRTITGLDIDIFPSENWLLDKFFYLSFFSVLKVQCWTAVSMATEPYLSYSREHKSCEIRTVENVQPFKYECWVCCFTVFTANNGLVSFREGPV